LANNDARAALLGTFMTGVRGRFISDPVATLRADNKLLQLRTAVSVGLRIPTTIVTNDFEKARSFVNRFSRVIVKPVKGTMSMPLFTQVVTTADLKARGVHAAPAIYQQFIEGTNHLRVHIFGNRILSARIQSED